MFVDMSEIERREVGNLVGMMSCTSVVEDIEDGMEGESN